MAHVELRTELDLESPWLVEGLPGVGLVGKIATDHLIEEFEMTHYGDVLCDGLPKIGVYAPDDYELRQPVRIYADEKRDLLALQSEVPVSPSAAEQFATCVTGWLQQRQVTPLYLSGFPAEKGPEPPALFGVATGAGSEFLTDAEVDPPGEAGVVSGPTGALVNRAQETDLDAAALVVESDPQFPDPEAARVLIQNGITAIADLSVDLSDLVDRAQEIRQQKERLAKRMQEAGDESSKAQPLRMYQ